MGLSVNLIVKNELSNLKTLLPQIEKFADEIVIIDTGSTDGTYQFLEKKDDIILNQIKWNNDFSEARNKAIELSTKKNIFWLDADDRLEENEIKKLEKIKNDLNDNTIYALKLIDSNTESYQLRIFPNKNIKFKFPVHEQLDFDEKSFLINYLDIKIVHIGYKDKNVLIEKQKRNIKILESIKNKNAYDYLQLAEGYKILRNYSMAEIYFKESLNKQIEKLNIEFRPYILLQLYKISILKGKEQVELLENSLEFGEFYPPVFYHYARFLYKNNHFKLSEKYFNLFLSLHKYKKYINPVPIKLKSSAIYFINQCQKKYEKRI